MMTKHRPKMVPFEIDLRANNTSYQDWTTTSAIDINSSSSTTRIFPREQKPIVSASSFVGMKDADI